MIWKCPETLDYHWKIKMDGHIYEYVGNYDPSDIQYACDCDLITACFLTLETLSSEKQWDVFDQLMELGRLSDPVIYPTKSARIKISQLFLS